jgi:hypothetical protein
MDIPHERNKLRAHLLKATLMLICGVSAVVVAAGDLWGWHGVALSFGSLLALGGLALAKINIEASMALDDLERLRNKT